jgi:Zn-dependent protease with chaperone function
LHGSIIRRFRDPRELRFIIGHEMGHIRCHHVKLMMLLELVKGFLPDKAQLIFTLPLLKWSREAEMSADRAGLICCQNLSAAEQALARLATGVDESTIGRVNIDVFLRQRERDNMSTVSEIAFFINQLRQSHPFIPDRITDLRLYSESPEYRHIWE